LEVRLQGAGNRNEGDFIERLTQQGSAGGSEER
jgi:hypothetical protein